MSTVATTRPINVAQLATELGCGVSISDDGATRRVIADVDEPTLQDKIGAHVAIDEAANRATLEQRAIGALATNKTYLARTAPTTAQNAAQVQALTREASAVIRLLLNRLDATD